MTLLTRYDQLCVVKESGRKLIVVTSFFDPAFFTFKIILVMYSLEWIMLSFFEKQHTFFVQ